MRFVFDDGAGARRAFGDTAHLATALDLQDIVPAPVIGSAEPLGKGGDRYLSRLAALASLAKSGGYDPDEPRDDHGRWTTSAVALLHEISAFLASTGPTSSADARAARGSTERGVEPSPNHRPTSESRIRGLLNPERCIGICHGFDPGVRHPITPGHELALELATLPLMALSPGGDAAAALEAGNTFRRSFATFRQLKAYLGSPGAGMEWHHIVEQSQIPRLARK